MSAVKEAAHLKSLLTQVFGYRIHRPVVIKEDNTSCIKMALNDVDQAKSKHYDIRGHYIRQQVGRCEVEISHIRTNLQVADVLSKNLPRVPFEKHRSALGVSNLLANPRNVILPRIK